MSHVDELLARSSLGGTDADRLAAHADPARTARVLRRSRARLSVVSAAPATARHRPVLLAVAVAAAVALLAGVLVLALGVLGARAPQNGPAQRGTGPAVATPSPTLAPSTPPTTEQPVTAAPNGFTACAGLGAGGFCPTKPECWDGYSQVYDIPAVSNKVSCSRRHLYQTVTAGSLGEGIRTQAQLESSAVAKRLCSDKAVARALGRTRLPSGWQVQKLPPPLEVEGGELFRCIVFTGEYRTSALKVRSGS